MAAPRKGKTKERVVSPTEFAQVARATAHAGLLEAALHLERKIVIMLSQKGHGRWYRDEKPSSGKGAYVKFKPRRGPRKGQWVSFVSRRLEGMGPHQASRPGEPPAPDTGRLRNSVRTIDTSNAKRIRVRVGTPVKYAPWLEFGTRYMAARPFMRPAFMLARSGMRKAMIASGARTAVELKALAGTNRRGGKQG